MSSVGDIIWGKKEKKRIRLTKADKDKIVKRQKYKCAKCKRDLTRTVVHYDHKKSLALGGSNTLRNYQALCPTCHAEKTREDRSKIAKRKRKRKDELPLF